MRRGRGRPGCRHLGRPPHAYAERTLRALGAPALGSSLRVCVGHRAPAPSAGRSAGAWVPACPSPGRRATGAPCPPKSTRVRRPLGAQRSPPARDWRPQASAASQVQPRPRPAPRREGQARVPQVPGSVSRAGRAQARKSKEKSLC